MKLLCKNEMFGLVPMFDEDYNQKRKLKFGEVYTCEIKKARNYQFHKLYFALINLAWEYQNEKTQTFFKNDITNFRKAVEISAGHCDTAFNIKLKCWTDIPKSIAFDKMDEFEFKVLYDRVKDVLFLVFLKDISQEEFERNLINF